MHKIHNRTVTPILRMLAAVVCLLIMTTLMAACSGRSKAEKLHAQGSILSKNHQYPQAIGKFEEALKLEPKRAGTLALCAEAYLQIGKPEQAVRLAKESIEVEAKQASAYLTLGQAHLSLAWSKGKVSPTGERKLDPEELRQAAEVAATLNKIKPDASEGILLQARINELNGQWDSAKQLYEGVLKKEPDNQAARLGLTGALMSTKKYVEAEQSARKSIGTEETPDPKALGYLAMSQAYQGKYNEAYESLAPYIDEKNKHPELSQYILAGRILLTQIQGLTDNRGTSSTALSTLSTSTLTTGTAQKAGVAGGGDELNLAVKRLASLGSVMKGRYPSLPESWYFRGVSYQFQGNAAETVHHMEEACTRAPGEKRFRLALVAAQMESKNYILARQELRTLLKNNPNDFDARLRMAQCHAYEGSYDESLELLRRLLLEFPGNKIVKEALGKVLVLTSDPENVDEGLAMLADASVAQELEVGGKEFIQAQSKLTEANEKLAAGQMTEADSKFLEAEQLFRKVDGLQPGNYLAKLKLADLALRRGDLFSTLAYVRKAAEIDPQFLPLKARIYARLGQMDAAGAIYGQLLEANPNAIGYQLAIAEMDFQRGRIEEAEKSYEAIMKKFPDDPRPYVRQAQVIAKRQNLKAAIESLTAILAKFPEDITLRLTLAQMYMSTNEPANAANILQQATSQQETRLATLTAQAGAEQTVADTRESLADSYQKLALAELLADQNPAAVNHADKIAQYDPTFKIEAGMIKALAEMRNGRADQALETLAKIQSEITRGPATLPMIYSLAFVAAGNLKQAAEVVGKQASLNENTVKLYLRMLESNPKEKLAPVAPALALQIYLSGNPNLNPIALALAESVLRALPEEPFVLSRKAEVCHNMGNTPEAMKIYRQMEKVMPDFLQFLLAEADLHMAMSEQAASRGDQALAQDEQNQASRCCERYLQKKPKDSVALQKLATIIQSQGKVEESNKLYRQAIEIDPANWSAYNNLAWNLGEANQLEEAAKLAEKALTGAADVGGVQDTLGWIELKRGHVDRAIDLLAKASQRLPNVPEVRFHLAQALQRKGLNEQAAGELEAIVLATPYYARINEVKGLLRQLNPKSEVFSRNEDASSSISQTVGAKL